MTKREYFKYNNPNVFDRLGKPIKPGDTVVFNSYYGACPHIGKVDHFTQSEKLAICYKHMYWKGKFIGAWAYRMPNTVIKLKSGRRKKQ